MLQTLMANMQSVSALLKNFIQNRKKSILLILLGNIILSAAVSLFVVDNGFISGGATGLALAIRHYLGGDLPLIVLGINLITFTIGFIWLGKNFALSTMVCTFSYPIFFKFFLTFNLAELIQFPPIVEASLAAVMIGFSLNLILRQGASAGNLDVIALILEKNKGFSLAITVNIIDACILMSQCGFSTISQIGFGLYIVFITTITMKLLENLSVKLPQTSY